MAVEDKLRKRHADWCLQAVGFYCCTLFQNLPGIVYRKFIKENNRIEFLNDMLQPMTGFSADELAVGTGSGCSMETLILPEDRARVAEAVREAIAHKEPFDIEYRIKSRDGEVRHFWERGKPIFGKDENTLMEENICKNIQTDENRCTAKKTPSAEDLLYIDGVIFDIRKLAEDKTCIAYMELNQIFNAAVDGICMIDKEFHVLQVNDTFCRLFGVSRGEILGRRCCDVLNCPFCKQSSGCPLTSIISGEKDHFECNPEIERSDGTRIPFILTAVPLCGPDGKPIGIVENFRDISRSRLMEESVRESEEKYSALVEQSKDGVAIIDAGGIIRFINKALAEMGGYAAEEAVGRHFLDFIAPDMKEVAAQRYRSCLDGNYISSYDTKLICKNGTISEVEASANLIHYHGKTETMVIIHDVTERKRREEELLKIQKLESLGVLAGGIAHDFNNLLAAIAGNLSVAQRYAESGYNLGPLLKEIQNATRQAKSLTQQLFTFARGGATIRKAVCLSDLIKNTAIFALSGSKTKCEFTLPDDLWWSEIDDGQIGQVINNLIINADQAMTEGGLIEISAENIILGLESGLPFKEGKYIKVSVKDHGTGIRREHLQKIFDPYFTTKQKGSGLGLAITYSIIKKHEGHITVESRVGAGTTFHIYLPAMEGKAWRIMKDDAREKIRTGHGRVLFMDDQQIMRAMVGRMLTSLGYEVVVAGEGDEAVELYKKARESGRPFDAVILDLTVPGGMGGEEAVRKLHEIDPDVKAIVSSGYANDPIMSEYREHGFRGVVAKPYEMKELSETLAHILHESEQFH